MSLLARTSKSLAAVDDDRAESTGEVNALLGRGSTFEGKLVFEGTVHIDGTFTGEIRSKDTLVIGVGAKVSGQVDVGTLVVNGELSGELRARKIFEMHAPAKVRGNVYTPVLVVDRGVIFEGTTHMENLDAAPAPAKGPKAG
jgi:cytoskeletal protein CcmA (bactofilin family)